MRRAIPLATQLLVLQLAIVLVTVGATAFVWVEQTRHQLDQQYGERALAIAESVAALDSVRKAFREPEPSALLQPIAEGVRDATGADFVVIADRNQIRLAHPDPSKIGQKLSTDATPALSGRSWVGVQTGTLGRSVRGKAPIYDERGQVIGVVSVGILEETVTQKLRKTLPSLLATALGIAAVGTLATWLLARRLKRQTFGLEPPEIAALLEYREAMLHGVKEGVLALDQGERVTLVNDTARRLLGLPADCVGRPLAELPLSERLWDVLRGVDTGADRIVLHEDRVLVLNRMPVSVRGEHRGWVVTLRDRTELDSLLRELDTARGTTDALRAQAHEFTNRMHTVVGLLELGEHEAALRYITRTTQAHERFATRIRERIEEPTLAALLLAKSAAASERGAELVLAEDSLVRAAQVADHRDAVLVIGNLVDNAVESLGRDGGRVEVSVRTTEEGLWIQVRDSGPGVSPELAEEVFRYGFTTKVAHAGGSRGLGLALTRQACLRRGGWIRVHNEGGAVFTALLPARRTTGHEREGALPR